MAKRPSSPSELRDAVERTVQATLGSAERQRDRTQGAIDEIAGGLRKGAEASLARGRRALDDRRPVTQEDLRELSAELRRIGRRLEAIEERLPAKRASAAGKRKTAGSAKPASAAAKRSAGSAKQPSAARRKS